jgi:predicted GIY-YIG superfamily endonuclease
MVSEHPLGVLEFLKRYAPVDDAFVDDFFGMANPEAPDEPSVNADVASKWLGVGKYHFVSQLKASYVQGIDYTVGKPTERKAGRADNARKVILLTGSCFKQMCMESRSKQATRVREYYLAVESTLFKYRAEVAEGLRRRIRELEANQRPRLSPADKQSGVMYVIAASETVTSLYKLGRTVNLSRRLASHESARADGLQIRYTAAVDDVQQVESCVKALLKRTQYRKYKEVYQVDIGVIKQAIAKCDELGIQTRRVLQRKGTTAKGGGGTIGAMKTYIVFARG